MITYTLNTPVTVGTLAQPLTISSLQVTSVTYSSTPNLAPLGAGELDITLTDPNSGVQEVISYKDSSVLLFWATLQSPAANTKLGDILSTSIFMKLLGDGKLPPGTLIAS